MGPSWGSLGLSWGSLGVLLGAMERLLGPSWRPSIKGGGVLTFGPPLSRGPPGTILGALGSSL
eukprot:1671740-Pyramimonas_sp.AAC.1